MEENVDGAGTAPMGSSAEAGTDDVWNDLGRQLADLGRAVANAVRSATDDPETQARARELKNSFDAMAREVGDAFTDAFSGESGQRVKDAAASVATAGRAVAEDVRPHIADFTRKAGDVLRDAASRLDRDRRTDESAEQQSETDGEGT